MGNLIVNPTGAEVSSSSHMEARPLMPRVPLYGDPLESARTLFLREVRRHAPEVLRDLRDQVLPVQRSLDHYGEIGFRPETEHAQHELADELQAWQRRHRLTTSPDSKADWITERARRTLQDWRSRSSGSLNTREEILDRDCQAITAFVSTWQNSEGEDRRKARWDLRQAIHRLRRHRRISTGHRPVGFHWWRPALVPSTTSTTLGDLSEDLLQALYHEEWTAAREDSLRAAFDELLEAWRRTHGPRRKEAAHFRWLALWQCRAFSYVKIIQYEYDWSEQTLDLLGHALAEGSKGHAQRILVDRGEPWIVGASSVWRDLWGTNNIDELRDTLRGLTVHRPAPGTVKRGLRDAAEMIGLGLRIGRPGRPPTKRPRLG